MTTLSRLVPVLAVLAAPALVACDREKDAGDDAGTTTGVTEADETEGTTAAGTEGDTEEPTEGTTEAGTEGATEGTSTGGAQPVVCDGDHFGVARACEGGTQFCAWIDMAYAWGSCVAEPECTPGAEDEDACESCGLTSEGVPQWMDTCGGSSTPLVLSFDGAAVDYAAAGQRFDLGPECAATDWPTAATPWLALDRDRSGAIEGGHELFGSATRLRGGAAADNGFTALQELDSDGDGRVTAADPGFAELVVWTDGDGDRRSNGLELQPLAAFGLVAIDLVHASERRCDTRGNCEVERAAFTYTDLLGRPRAGEVVDVHLGCQ